MQNVSYWIVSINDTSMTCKTYHIQRHDQFISNLESTFCIDLRCFPNENEYIVRNNTIVCKDRYHILFVTYHHLS